jgi:GMP synthase (glutamine-hydrolysing)
MENLVLTRKEREEKVERSGDAKKGDVVLVVDFGSQYTQRIARVVREGKVYCEVHPFHKVTPQLLEKMTPRGLILSGGPATVTDPNAPRIGDWIFKTGIPILGICYGLQFMVDALGGTVVRSDKREYGKAFLKDISRSLIFDDVVNPGDSLQVWMSHGDRIAKLPEGFRTIATSNGIIAAIEDERRKFYALQWHPEVDHTIGGRKMIWNFLHKICGFDGNWTMGNFRQESVAKIREQVDGRKVVHGISGGVDSAVAAALIHEAVGDNLTCIFVDNGLLRADEATRVLKALNSLGVKIIAEDASELFLSRLKGIADPEKKRKIIGHTFIDVFEKVAERIGGVSFLGQGTLYPDVIESVPVFGGPTRTIKSHHNVGGLKDFMKLALIEPFRFLFKDEVRVLGKEMGLPDEIVMRWPFPGPGLGIRVFDQAISPFPLELCRNADRIFRIEVRAAGLYDKIWQGLVGIPPGRTVGVMGDERTHQHGCVLRAVTSADGMTAEPYEFPRGFITKVVTRIVNEVPGINRGYEDHTSKPPGTIEWE